MQNFGEVSRVRLLSAEDDSGAPALSNEGELCRLL
jgi:hypothetical protein